MRLVYLDEGGISNERQEPYFVVAGVIVNPDQSWRLLEKHFQELTAEYFPKHRGPPIAFHAMDIWHGSRLFNRNDPEWPLDKRISLLKRLATIPKKFGIPVVMGHLHRPSARQTITSAIKGVSPANVRAIMHAEAFMLAARRVEQWMIQNAANEVAMLIAEDTHEVKETIQLYHRIYTDRTFESGNFAHVDILADKTQDAGPWLSYRNRTPFRSKHIIDAVHFAKKEHSLLLQIADHSAYIMKRKLMKKQWSEELFSLIAPQIAWPSTEGAGLAIRVKRSQLRQVTKLGTVLISELPSLDTAFKSLCAGIRSGRDKHNLSPHLQTVRAAQYQAFDTPEGKSYLNERPTLKTTCGSVP
jgi:hypothetical protein